MFGGQQNTLKPKNKTSKGYLPLPASFSRSGHKQRFPIIITIILIVLIYVNPFRWTLLHSSHRQEKYPPAHPYTSKQIIETNSRYIYPKIEHASLLKELGTKNLVKEIKVRDSNFPEIEKTLIRSYNYYDDVDANAQKLREDDENAGSNLAKAKNFFKNKDKYVYKPKKSSSYPELIVVTAIDFEKYSFEALVKIVQNRVNYAHGQNYGIYVRWYQEFLPVLNSFSYLNDKDKRKWVRLYCLRAAMFAFPKAKWFWYLDEDALIMDLSIDMNAYILNPDILDPIIQRDQLLIPGDGSFKTLKNLKAEEIRLILTQSDTKIETVSFLIKNDVIGKAILESWGDNLFLNYMSFPYGPDSAITHILQWHPFILSKTAIVPAKSICSRQQDPGASKSDNKIYKDGDFVVQWSNCVGIECEQVLNHYDATAQAKTKLT